MFLPRALSNFLFLHIEPPLFLVRLATSLYSILDFILKQFMDAGWLRTPFQ